VEEAGLLGRGQGVPRLVQAVPCRLDGVVGHRLACRVLAGVANLVDDEALDLAGRDRPGRAGVPAALLGADAGVVPVAPRLVLAGVRRRHGAAARRAAQQALEQGVELGADRGTALAAVALQQRLHLLPCVGVHDGGVLAGVDLSLVAHLAEVRDVGQELVQRRLGERPAAALAALVRNRGREPRQRHRPQLTRILAPATVI
jgi:hypothetical protein